MQGRAAGYTGSKLAQLYESISIFGTAQADIQGSTGNTFTYSVQGNSVTNETVPSVEMGFFCLLERGMGCDPANRLMIAVEAGGIEGAGDQRCTDRYATPAAGGCLHVDNPDGTVLVHIDIVGNGTSNPLLKLREQYDEWRAMHPCPGSSSPAYAPSASPMAMPMMTSGATDNFVNIWRMILEGVVTAYFL